MKKKLTRIKTKRLKHARKTPHPRTVKNERIACSAKEEFFKVYEALGGTPAFIDFVQKSNSNRRMFYMTFAKMLPKEISVHNATETPESLPFKVEIVGGKNH